MGKTSTNTLRQDSACCGQRMPDGWGGLSRIRQGREWKWSEGGRQGQTTQALTEGVGNLDFILCALEK